MLKKPIILPEGYPFIIVALLLGVIGLWMKWYYAAVVPFVLAVYFTYFFRCPPRNDKITPVMMSSSLRRTAPSWTCAMTRRKTCFWDRPVIKSPFSFPSSTYTATAARWKGRLPTSHIRRANSCRRMRKGWALKMNAVPSGSRARTDPSWSSSSRGYWHDASFPGKIWETA